jgi:tRNA threonylcarbamoyladenosine biosynthesis protein TsaE
MLPEVKRTFDSFSAADTDAFGVQLGRLLVGGQVIALDGDLGAGKTTLVQGIAAGLQSPDRVTSPTFTLINEYRTPTETRILHIDCYRLGEQSAALPDAAIAEAAAIGLEECFDADDAVVIVEWAERIAPLLPADHLRIILTTLDEHPDGRRIECTTCGAQSVALLRQLHFPEMSGT